MRLVHVPGLGLDGRSSEALRRCLGSRVESRVVLLPSLGLRHEPRDGQLSVDGLADRLLAALPPDPVVLLAHSQSCQVAVAAAASRPAALAALVLLGPTMDPRARPLPLLAVRWLRTAACEPAWQVPVLVRQYARTGLRSMASGLRAGLEDRIEERIPAFAGPVVVVRGSEDRICPRDWAEALAGRAQRGRVVEVDGAGHMAVHTHPAQVASVAWDVVTAARGAP
ncbi:MAG: alpha/beta hydrolase fold protein [Frankiales bacterium]|jgi:pimeloyl-ACP methyl ester carboxylesterase|nr:alpha/beta hydrolase fold protein [Frankiales bacterium]